MSTAAVALWDVMESQREASYEIQSIGFWPIHPTSGVMGSHHDEPTHPDEAVQYFVPFFICVHGAVIKVLRVIRGSHQPTHGTSSHVCTSSSSYGWGVSHWTPRWTITLPTNHPLIDAYSILKSTSLRTSFMNSDADYHRILRLDFMARLTMSNGTSSLQQQYTCHMGPTNWSATREASRVTQWGFITRLRMRSLVGRRELHREVAYYELSLL